MMARLEGIMQGGSVLTCLIFFLARRSYGRVIKPALITHLASMLVAWRIGCRLQPRLWHPSK